MTDASDNTPMDRFPDEILMAYVDGELSAGERKAVEAALARDASLVRTVASYLYTRGPLSRPYDAVLTAPIPYRLLAFLANAGPPLGRRAPGPADAWKLRRIIAGFWAPFLSPAAAIAVVLAAITGGWLLQQAASTDFVSLDSRGGLVASAAVQAALEATPGNVRADVGSLLALEPRLTFATVKDGWCRQYQLFHRNGRVAGGLACRDHGVWRVIVQTPAAPRAHTTGKFVPAGNDDGVVGDVRNAIKDGEVLDREEEERLIRARWPAKSQAK